MLQILHIMLIKLCAKKRKYTKNNGNTGFWYYIPIYKKCNKLYHECNKQKIKANLLKSKDAKPWV